MRKPLTPAKSVSPLANALAWISIVAGTLFVVLLVSLHALEPEFDPTWRFVSEYALGRFGWLMQLAFMVLAASLGASALAIAPQTQRWYGYIGVGLLLLAALGLLIAGLFNTDPVITSRGEPATFQGKMHVLGASLDYTPIAALLVALSVARNEGWRPVRNRLFITVGVTLVVLAAFMLTLPYDGELGPDDRAGLFGRFLLVSYVGWIATVGLHLVKLRRQAQSPREG